MISLFVSFPFHSEKPEAFFIMAHIELYYLGPVIIPTVVFPVILSLVDQTPASLFIHRKTSAHIALLYLCSQPSIPRCLHGFSLLLVMSLFQQGFFKQPFISSTPPSNIFFVPFVCLNFVHNIYH